MPHRLARITSLAVLAVAAAARGDIDVEVGNADSITGTISPATETEVIRFRVPAGSSITIKAKAAKKGPDLHLVLRDPAGTELRTADGKSAAVTGVVATESGVHSAELTSKNGTTTGDYSVSISWKSPPKGTATATLASGEGASLSFSADLGAVASVSVKAAKGSQAVGALTSLTGPGPSLELLVGSSAKRTLASGGDFVLAFRNDGAAAGDLTATVKVKPPKPSKKKIALTSKVIGPGGQFTDFALAGLLGTSGGTITVPVALPGDPGAGLSGTSVTVPAGALGAPTTIIVATAPPINPPPGDTGAGPSVFFGPEGTQFNKNDKSTRATITLPYDPVFDSAAAESILIYTRDAKGKVTIVPPPYVFDTDAHTITFPTSHFSSFRAMVPGTGPVTDLLTYAGVDHVQDVCLAFEPPGDPNLAEFFTAEGSSRVVGALRISTTGFPFLHQTWAGGGNSTADGTPRLQYKFVDSVTSVFSVSDDTTYAATTTQVFKIGSDGLVNLYAGAGPSLDGGDGGLATAATFVTITSVVVSDDGTVFVCDAGAHRIRLVDPSTLNISTWAGDGTAGVGADGTALTSTTFVGPNDMDFTHDGGLYVTDGGRVRKLVPPNPLLPGGANVTVAGDAGGATGSSGDDGPALSARFRVLTGISVALDLFDPTVEKLVVCDFGAHTVRLVDLANDKVRLLAGQHDVPGYSGDFSAAPGLVDSPMGIVALPSQIIFADTLNDRVRTRIFPAGFP